MASATLPLPTRAPGDIVAAVRKGAPPLSIPRIGFAALLVIMLLLVNKGGIAGSAVFFGVLGILALQSPEWAFKAMTLSLGGDEDFSG